MTAEMIREEATPIPYAVPAEVDESTSRPVRRPDALATQEQLDGIDKLIEAFEKDLGPVVPPKVQEQFYADLAAADAKIGYVR